MLKPRQKTQNGVTYAKPHVTKPRFNLITILSLPEMGLKAVNQKLPHQLSLGNLPDRPLSSPNGE